MYKSIVVKCGGHAEVDAAAVCADLARLAAEGRSVVAVHGGSAEIDRLAARLDVPVRRLASPAGGSSRYTDAAMLEVVRLALAGGVKPRLVAELARCGAAAVGLTGLDGSLVTAERKAVVHDLAGGRKTVVRGNHGGRISKVDIGVVRALLDSGYLPVVSPPAVTAGGEVVNVDADRMAAALADALGADALVMLTGAPGVLRDPDDPGSLMTRLDADSGPQPEVSGGMAVKIHAGRAAAEAGVRRVVIADGRLASPVRSALAGGGTELAAPPPESRPR